MVACSRVAGSVVCRVWWWCSLCLKKANLKSVEAVESTTKSEKNHAESSQPCVFKQSFFLDTQNSDRISLALYLLFHIYSHFFIQFFIFSLTTSFAIFDWIHSNTTTTLFATNMPPSISSVTDSVCWTLHLSRVLYYIFHLVTLGFLLESS